MTDLPAWWDRAVADFLAHITQGDCSFGGGLSRATWYWLAIPDCPRAHSDRCAACALECDHVLRWWSGKMPTDSRYPDVEMWEMALCADHAQGFPSDVVFVKIAG